MRKGKKKGNRNLENIVDSCCLLSCDYVIVVHRTIFCMMARSTVRSSLPFPRR